MLIAAPLLAQSEVKLSLVPNTTENSATLSLTIKMEEGWHTYYKDPGGPGYGAKLDLKLPKDVVLTPFAWPEYKTFEFGGFTNNGYEDEVTLTATLYYKPMPYTQQIKIKGNLNYLICKEVCIPQTQPIDITLPIKGTGGLSWIVSIVFLGLMGGLLLNVMPCVFPVLSLKVFHFLELAEKENVSPVKYGAAFSSGVIVSFWSLALIIMGLKQSGTALGWGFQLQSPWFVAGLCVLFFAMAISMLGLFEFGAIFTRFGGVGQKKKNMWSAFWSGVLTTLVATPCTGPFLGAAIGYAFIVPFSISVLVFTSIALGLALPYQLLVSFPALTQSLPKPGAWMISAKKLLSIPLFLTALWLAWLFVTQINTVHQGPSNAVKATKTQGNLTWTYYTPYALEKAHESDKPIFIKFTAGWCITCQVNEKTTFNVAKTQKFFKDNQVQLILADWTNHDDSITALLETYNRNSIPFYVYYPNGTDKETFKILPELISPKTILQLKD